MIMSGKHAKVDPFDFVVTDIEFIVHRKTDSNWKCGYVVNKKSYIIVFTFDGSARCTMEDCEYSVEKGDVLLFKKGEPHTSKSISENPWIFCSIAFDLHFLTEDAKNYLFNFPTLISSKYHSEYNQLFKNLIDIWYSKIPGHKIKTRSIISDVFYRLIRENTFHHQPVQYVKLMEHIDSYILQHYKEDICTAKLAVMANLSESYFRRTFKEYKGCSVIQYVNTLKISNACELIRSGLYSITEIAEAVGYNNVYYFSRIFKKHTVVCPWKFLHKR